MASDFRETVQTRLVCLAFAAPCLAGAAGLFLLALKARETETGARALLQGGSFGLLGLGLLLASIGLIRVLFQPTRDF